MKQEDPQTTQTHGQSFFKEGEVIANTKILPFDAMECGQTAPNSSSLTKMALPASKDMIRANQGNEISGCVQQQQPTHPEPEGIKNSYSLFLQFISKPSDEAKEQDMTSRSKDNDPDLTDELKKVPVDKVREMQDSGGTANNSGTGTASSLGLANHKNKPGELVPIKRAAVTASSAAAPPYIQATLDIEEPAPVGSLEGPAITATTLTQHGTSLSVSDGENFPNIQSSEEGRNVDENVTLEEAEAQQLSICRRHGRSVGSLAFVAIVVSAIFIGINFGSKSNGGNAPQSIPETASSPSMAPFFDSRHTLAIVQERGFVRCGMRDYQTEGTFHYQLCQAIAAVALNDPDAVEKVDSTESTRFALLYGRSVDTLAGGETFTIERSANEPTTGSSFVFSTPYYYDGIVFAGNEAFVSCAQDQIRYDECSDLVICVNANTTDHRYVIDPFASDFFVVTSNVEASLEFYLNGTCNVVANGRLELLNFKQTNADLFDSGFYVGNKTLNSDPLAFVTRSDDPEWSNIVNWVLQALFYGERQGITKSETDCQRTMDSLAASDWTGLNFLNAVYCVGNYGEIYDSSQYSEYRRTPINTINNGTAMMQVISYGDLDNAKEGMFSSFSETYATIKDRNSLKCGLLVQDGYSDDDIAASEGLFGMSMNFCQTLAASMFNGNLEAVEYTPFQNADSSLAALNSEEVDVLLGVPANKDWSFGNETFNGVTYSTPYFYGNETGISDVSIYSIINRQDDAIFSSFVNCIVLSTIDALKRGITISEDFAMPPISLFGEDMLWALKDAISAYGNYDEIYFNNFDAEESRGRNVLNGGQPQPQLLDMPGFDSNEG